MISLETRIKASMLVAEARAFVPQDADLNSAMEVAADFALDYATHGGMEHERAVSLLAGWFKEVVHRAAGVREEVDESEEETYLATDSGEFEVNVVPLPVASVMESEVSAVA